ncbi:hypothetical protein IAR55_000215 [Kwoniella newhampshirensis]|uniref:Crossover junction endonuclease MUS81 n=1 Tax=Kwoniella newhampshirensis TaxID=1651941 RepID=A0AAW0Z631_9TREE
MPRAKPPCGNPLFLQWMEELRDAAREKGMKSAEGYSKACKSLLNCPVTYTRPRELVVLQHIGEKTVGILEKKWKIHCEENGIVVESPVRSKAKGKARADPSELDQEDASLLSDSTNQAPKPQKIRKPSKPKPYIPARGSGPYGILMALVLAIEQPEINTQVFQTKSEIIRVAQEYCDASYEHSEKGNYFTAWSGMKTLVNRGYVYVTGNPHKYCLTEDGYEVAVAIRNLRPEFSHMEKMPFLHTPAVGGSNTALIPSQRVPVTHKKSASLSSAVSSEPASPRKDMNGRRPEKFQFWYIDSSGARTSDLSNAMIRLDPDDFINLRKIEFRYSQRDHPIVSQLRLVYDDATARIRDGSNFATLYAFIVEEAAPPICSKFDDGASGKENAPVAPQDGHVTLSVPLKQLDDEKATDNVLDVSNESDQRIHSPFPIDAILARSSSALFSRTQSAPITNVGSPTPKLTSSLAAEAALRRAGHPSSTFGRSQSALVDLSSASKLARPAPRLSSHMPSPILPPTDDHPSPSLSSISTSNVPNFLPMDAIVYPPGSYEVVLIVDTREVESRSNRDKIAESLAAKGIKVETRALRLGDMCWIARRIEGDLGGEEDECVLDYVAERKRLDDLCSSIRDGRYNEQCFRLSNSGINHIYYIVEDWQVAERMEYHGLQIMTAKSQIQVHNRFFLKETHKLSETIDFLATMTNVIKSSHQGKPVHVIPTRFLSRSTYGPLQAHLKETHPLHKFHTSFVAYQDLNDKSASQTLREKFARMLLCVKGMSAERVSAVLDEWETPVELWESLKERDKAGDGAEVNDGAVSVSKKRKRGKEMMFADRVKGEGRRKIGDALSKELWKAFMGDKGLEYRESGAV